MSDLSPLASREVAVHELHIPVHARSGGFLTLPGTLALPESAGGLVLFAHGSGSSRLSPRNRHVAAVLNDGWIATLLFDLLTEQEATDRLNVFDIELLADRLVAAMHFCLRDPLSSSLPIGLFGASTGAAAALAAAARERHVRAVVSRGGRPDLAGEWLGRVEAPTLLVVGGEDRDVLELNREAYAALSCEKQLAVVPRASHLFEEPRTLEEVARLAGEWFGRHLQIPAAAERASGGGGEGGGL